MSKDGKDAELIKLTEDDCTLIKYALLTMLEQLYRAKLETPMITEEFRALFKKQETEILAVKNKVWDIQCHLIDQRINEELEKAERV